MATKTNLDKINEAIIKNSKEVNKYNATNPYNYDYVSALEKPDLAGNEFNPKDEYDVNDSELENKTKDELSSIINKNIYNPTEQYNESE